MFCFVLGVDMQGKHWSLHGHVHQGRMVLLPEEALFLMECVSGINMYRSENLEVSKSYECLA